MFLKLSATNHDEGTPEDYERLTQETNELMQALIDTRNALDRGYEFKNLDKTLCKEIMNLDMSAVHVELVTDNDGNLALHVY